MAPKLWLSSAKRLLKKKPAAAEASAIKGLAGFRKASTVFGGTVDKGVYQQNPALASRAEVIEGMDARLVAIDPFTMNDRYYVLQGLADPKVPVRKSKRFYAYQRWGRTGTGGVCRLQGPMEEHKVQAHLMKVFKSKTGAVWGLLKPGEKAKPGKYWLVVPSEVDPTAAWQYFVDDGVDKKENGWYPYDVDASKQVEQLYAEHIANKGGKNPTEKRYVPSGSFTYCIDLKTLSQQSCTTMKERRIRRVSSTASTKTSKGQESSFLNAHSSSSSGEGFVRAETHSKLNRTDTAETVAAPWNDAVWNARAAGLQTLKRSSSTFSEFPGLPDKRRRQSLTKPSSMKDVQESVTSGDVKNVPVPMLRAWMRSIGVVATGNKEELLRRASTLGKV